jgi:hypothetical protein
VHHSCDAEETKLKSDNDDCGSTKRKQIYGGAFDGVWQSLGLTGTLRVGSGCWFYVEAFSRNLASVAVKMFSH